MVGRIPASILGPGQIERIRNLVADGFETIRSVAVPDNRVVVQVYQVDDETGDETPFGVPVEVVLAYSGNQPGLTSDVSAAVARTSGQMYRFAPWDVLPGMRFQLPSGSWAKIDVPAPVEQFGIVTAHWTATDGVV